MEKSGRVLIGRVTSPVGLRGEVKVYSYASSPDRFRKISRVWTGGTARVIESVRMQGRMVVLKLSGVTDRNQADALRGQDVEMDEAELEPLGEGQWYIRDLLGFRVQEEDGTPVGTLTDVLTDRPQDILVVRSGSGKEILIPLVEEFVPEIDTEAQMVIVRLIEGMAE